MARFYVDNDIARRVVSHLEIAGHDAWLRWTQAWHPPESHSGILVVPQGMRYGIYWDADRISGTILALLNQNLPLVGALYRWKEGRWQQRSGRDWILP